MSEGSPYVNNYHTVIQCKYRLANHLSVTETSSMKTDTAAVALRRKRLKQWIDERHDGVQAAFVLAAGITSANCRGC